MTLHAGFADPVRDSQACFRAVLDAMARPGTVQRVGAPNEVPVPLGRAAAAVMLTLLDADTPVWLDPAVAAVAPWLAFHCGAPLVGVAEAAFGVALECEALGMLPAGSDDGPELGATLIVQVAALGSGAPWRLSGPGLAARLVLRADGLGPGFVAAWAANRGRFPRGVDLILCAGDQVAALPRTVRVEEG